MILLSEKMFVQGVLDVIIVPSLEVKLGTIEVDTLELRWNIPVCSGYP